MLSCWIMLIISLQGWNLAKAEPVPIFERQSFPTTSTSVFEAYESCSSCYPDSSALQSSTTWAQDDTATLPITDLQSPQVSTAWVGSLTTTSENILESQASIAWTTPVQDVSVTPTTAWGTQPSAPGSFPSSGDGITATTDQNSASITALSYGTGLATMVSLNPEMTPYPTLISTESTMTAIFQTVNIPNPTPATASLNSLSVSTGFPLSSGSSASTTPGTQSAGTTIALSNSQGITAASVQTAQSQVPLKTSALTTDTTVAYRGTTTFSESSSTAKDSIAATSSSSATLVVSLSSSVPISPSTALPTVQTTFAPAVNSAGVTLMTCLLAPNTVSQNILGSVGSSSLSPISQSSSTETTSTTIATHTSNTSFIASTTSASKGTQGANANIATGPFLGGVILAAALNL